MKRILFLIIVIVMILALFTGCSENDEQNQNSENQQNNEIVEESNNEESNNSNIQEEVTVNIFHHMSEEGKRKALDQWTSEVSKNNPEIEFNVEGMDFNQYQTNLKTRVAAGDPPDVMFGRPKAYADMIESGHIMDLTGKDFINNIAESATSSMKIDGKVYGIAINLGTMGVFYNKDIFDEEGVEVPQTFSEFIEVCDTFEKRGIIPKAHGFKDAWTAQVDFQSDFQGGPLSKIPSFYEDIQNGNKDFADFPELKNSLERYAKRISYSSGDDFGTDYPKSLQMFATGKTAMVLQGAWAIGEIRKINPDGNFGFFLNPAFDDPDENLLNMGVDGAFMVSSKTEVEDAVFKLFDFATSPTGADIWVENSNTISVVKGVSTENVDSIVSDIMKYVDSGKTYNAESREIFSGQHDSIFRQIQEEFAADPDRSAEKYIERLDNEFDAID